jgi:hypothetical protein
MRLKILFLFVLIQVMASAKMSEAQNCGNNMGFENGTMGGWQTCHHSPVLGNLNCCPIKCEVEGIFNDTLNNINAPLGVCGVWPFQTSATSHTITQGVGTDPNTNGVVTVVATDGGNYSMRLGKS